MATDANWRLDPFTNEFVYLPIVNESQTVALDSTIGRYGFRLEEAPRIVMSGDSLTVVSDPGGVTYTEISFSQAPSAGEYRVDESNAESGFVEFHSSENGNSFLVSYSGKGSIIPPGVNSNTVTAGSGSFTTTSTSFVDVDNLELSYTSSGRIILVYLTSDQLSTPGYWGVTNVGAALARADLQIIRDSDVVGHWRIENDPVGASANTIYIPCNYMCVDNPGVGTYTYKAQVKKVTGTTAYVIKTRLGILELSS